MPLDYLSQRLAELPRDREIVAYCRGQYCVLAHDAVRLLTTMGCLHAGLPTVCWSGAWRACR